MLQPGIYPKIVKERLGHADGHDRPGPAVFCRPLTPLKLEQDRENEVKYCNQCMFCEELMLRQTPVGCVLYNRPYTARFLEIRKQKGKLAELHT
jgi:hypothetical protein